MSTPVTPLNLLAGVERFGKDSGGWSLLEEAEDGAEREFLARVDFSLEFSGPPVVHVAIVGFDIDNRDFSRLRVRALYIDRGGFTVCVSTCFGTRVHSVDVSWLALGT